MKLNTNETKLLKDLKNEKKQEVKKIGSYLGYVIPKNHPDNELTATQKKIFQSARKIAQALVKKNILEVVADDRRITAYDLVEVDNA